MNVNMNINLGKETELSGKKERSYMEKIEVLDIILLILLAFGH